MEFRFEMQKEGRIPGKTRKVSSGEWRQRAENANRTDFVGKGSCVVAGFSREARFLR